MRIFEFADFILDETERTLFRGGEAVQLAPKVFDTLVVLVKNHNRLVTKDALMQEIWRDTFVEENNLTQYIFVLRRVFSENNEGRKFIETVPRRGYRFVADVREISVNAERGMRSAELKTASGEFEISNLKSPIDEATEIEKANFERAAEKSSTDEAKKTPPDERQSADDGRPADIEKTHSALRAPRPALESEPPQKLRQRFVFLSLLTLLLVALGGSFVLRRAEKTWSPENLKFKRLTESGDLFGAAISPDGNSLAYVTRGKSNEVRLKNISTDSEIVVARADSGEFNSPRFSPDGNFIYYAYVEPNQNGAAFRVPVFGGEPRRVAENLFSEFSVSPDGGAIAFPRRIESEKKHVVVVASTDGSGGERTVAECGDPDFFELWGPAPAWSADGARLTVATGNFGAKQRGLLDINLQTGERRELPLKDKWLYIARLEWTSDDALVVAAKKEAGENLQLWQIKFPDGAAARITNDAGEYSTFDLDRAAKRIAATQTTENFHLWLFDRETKQAKQLTFGANHREGLEGLAFAPDNRILYTLADKNEYDIFSMNADGSDVRQLTKHAGRLNIAPAAAPDGNSIAFVSDRADGATTRVWLMNADGSNPKQLTPASSDAQTVEGDPYFSPDGQWIYYTFYRSGRGSIYKISVEGGEPIEVRRDAAVPVVSPDGREIAVNVFDDTAARQWQLRVQSLDGTIDKSFDFPIFFRRSRWLPAAPRTLVTAGTELDGNNLWLTNLETSERRQITDFKAERIDRFDVSKDGRFFVVARGSELYDAVLIEK